MAVSVSRMGGGVGVGGLSARRLEPAVALDVGAGGVRR
jgi:hypothetical protein